MCEKCDKINRDQESKLPNFFEKYNTSKKIMVVNAMYEYPSYISDEDMQKFVSEKMKEISTKAFIFSKIKGIVEKLNSIQTKNGGENMKKEVKKVVKAPAKSAKKVIKKAKR